MNVLIIEDELPAQQQILRLMAKHYPELKIAGILDSITDSVKWLKLNTPDIIFMDVELSDGNCFEIFKMVEVKSMVIITTAYQQYALNAFHAKAIDYLLKPIEDTQFCESVDRCMEMIKIRKTAVPAEEDAARRGKEAYKQRYTITVGNQIVVIDLQKVAYFISENKSTYLVTFEKKQFILDEGLDTVEQEVDPALFFRISRNCLASLNSIDRISKYFNQRLKVTLKPASKVEMLVSRARVPQLMTWLEGGGGNPKKIE
ncbi:MAG: LytTR family DNA-binding domain-containing protein [Bacteroidales bacterium]|jgi:DNA-binding LytR/AlgR family response regulator|nr:LytTR family DNA-binding domain-containing protein [Bacteroidales bacterium]MCI2121337.1 LytTR family DNA-binding domain-containing protein [Bacteroidales bacterium]MCI2145912.1 LytTR family DNA-binding domain-containing protein [Bacteroidales bacterium]